MSVLAVRRGGRYRRVEATNAFLVLEVVACLGIIFNGRVEAKIVDGIWFENFYTMLVKVFVVRRVVIGGQFDFQLHHDLQDRTFVQYIYKHRSSRDEHLRDEDQKTNLGRNYSLCFIEHILFFTNFSTKIEFKIKKTMFWEILL